MRRIAMDRHVDSEPLLARQLDNPNAMLRATAAYVLVGLWHLLPYLDRVLVMLEDGDEDEVEVALEALALLLPRRPPESGLTEWRLARDRIIKALIRRLLADDDVEVQRRCYSTLLEGTTRASVWDLQVPEPFDRATDVDWRQLAPWLEPGQVPDEWLRPGG